MGYLEKNRRFLNTDTLIEFDPEEDTVLSSYFLSPERIKDDKSEIDKELEHIYSLDMDNEIKANLINLYNALKIAKTDKEKQRIQKDINKIKKQEKI